MGDAGTNANCPDADAGANANCPDGADANVYTSIPAHPSSTNVRSGTSHDSYSSTRIQVSADASSSDNDGSAASSYSADATSSYSAATLVHSGSTINDWWRTRCWHATSCHAP